MWIRIVYGGFEYVLEDLGNGDVEEGEKVLKRYIYGALRRVFTSGFPDPTVWFIKEKGTKLPQIIDVFVKPESVSETQWMDKNKYKLKDTIEGALVEAGVTNTIVVWLEI